MMSSRKPIAFTVLVPDQSRVVLVEANKTGFTSWGELFPSDLAAAEYADTANAALGITPAMREVINLRALFPMSTATEEQFPDATSLVEKAKLRMSAFARRSDAHDVRSIARMPDTTPLGKAVLK